MLRTIAIALAPIIGAVLFVPVAMATSDSMEAARRIAEESAGKGVLVCVDGQVTRRPARSRDSTWEQVFGVQEFRCSDWRLREEFERGRPRYAASDTSTAEAAPRGGL
ncbi:hypothetical protein [Methylibium petroleiphilum]|uniref:hypothetical protein n=1 Tax=Methylibium petroleiphilum TaxID=105560 RepID=UPI0005A5035E|nr:hypothetical protein [Methylibium petroleiphilum]